MNDDLQLALTIELPGLRWQREGHDMHRFVSATRVLKNSSLDMSVYLINEYIYMNEFAIKLEYSKQFFICTTVYEFIIFFIV